MDYKDIIETSKNGDVNVMWESVGRISDFLCEMKEIAPEKVKRFLHEEYEKLNGRHFNERLARKIVGGMYHTENNDDVVSGEIVPIVRAKRLLDGIDESR